MSIIMGMMMPMLLFMLKSKPLKGAVSIKRAAAFVNEYLPGSPVVPPDAAEKERGGDDIALFQLDAAGVFSSRARP